MAKEAKDEKEEICNRCLLVNPRQRFFDTRRITVVNGIAMHRILSEEGIIER